MCTLTWAIQPDGYDLAFNRDERLDRAAERPPGWSEDGVLCPEDGEAGGTWISVNRFGVTLALLNLYQTPVLPKSPRSRGLLMRDLAPLHTGFLSSLVEVDWNLYAPLQLLVLSYSGDANFWVRWTGVDLWVQKHTIPGFLSSSALDAGRILPEREQLYRAWSDHHPEMRMEDRQRFHRTHRLDRPELGPQMRRLDAATRSHVWIQVRRDQVSMEYERPTFGGEVAPSLRTTGPRLPLPSETPEVR